MGWLTTHREKGMSNAAWFAREFPSIEILDSHTKSNVFYAACRPKKDPETVFALVCLLSWAPNDYYSFGYKDIEESMGPNEIGCPDRILDLLTPTDSEYANGWREACRKRNAVLVAKPKVKKGDCVKFTAPITFTSGVSLDTFTFEARNNFRYGYQRFTISGWRERDYDIVTAA
jgi:hypothetical protein